MDAGASKPVEVPGRSSNELQPMSLLNFLCSLRMIAAMALTETEIWSREAQKTNGGKKLWDAEVEEALSGYKRQIAEYATYDYPAHPNKLHGHVERMTDTTLFMLQHLKRLNLRRPESPIIYSLSDLPCKIGPTFSEHYERLYVEIKKIGRGAFGTVYQVLAKSSNTMFAVKKIKAEVLKYARKEEHEIHECARKEDDEILDSDEMTEATKEVWCLFSLQKHPNIVHYEYNWIQAEWRDDKPRETTTSSSQSDASCCEHLLQALKEKFIFALYIKMELCATNLGTLLKIRNSGLEECRKPDDSIVQESLKHFRQIMDGMAYMHSKGFYHGDIKLDNILIDFEGRAKVADFGLSSVRSRRKSRASCSSTSRSSRATPSGDSSSAESAFFNNKQYPFQEDIYDLGKVLVELLIPFRSMKKLRDEMTEIQKCRCLKEYQKDVRDLVLSMRNEVPGERPTAQKILENPLFSKEKQCTDGEAIEQVTASLPVSCIDHTEMATPRED